MSKQYEDGLHFNLEKKQELDIHYIAVHRKCVDKYCHTKTIQRAIHERDDVTHEDIKMNFK